MSTAALDGVPAHAAIPATVVAAASFDDAIAITGYTLCINLAVRNSGNAAWSVAHGPLSIVLGIAAGTVAALIAAATRLWTTGARRSLVMVFMGAPLVGLGFRDQGPCACGPAARAAHRLWCAWVRPWWV